jgi:mRNA interferase MazF
MNPQSGEIWLADLGLAAKTRPAVIVSRQDPDPPRALVLYVPLTTQRKESPYEVPLPRLAFLDRESVANVQGLGSLPTCVLNAELARFPRKSWNDSRSRWRSPWIFSAIPINAQPGQRSHLAV